MNSEISEIENDVMRMVVSNRKIKDRIEKLLDAGYTVMVGNTDGCWEYGSKTLCDMGAFKIAHLIPISTYNRKFRHIPYGVCTLYVLLKEGEPKKIHRKMKLKKLYKGSAKSSSGGI